MGTNITIHCVKFYHLFLEHTTSGHVIYTLSLHCEPYTLPKVYGIPIILAQGADNHNMQII